MPFVVRPTRSALFLICLFAVASCGKSSSNNPSTPTTPNSPTPSGGSCRNGIGTYQIVATGGGFTSTTIGSCTFNSSTVEGTCTNQYTDTTGQSIASVSVTRHATRGDIVDEIAVIPPLTRGLTTTTTTTGTSGNSTGTSTLTYDSQKRLTRIVAVSAPSGISTTTVYSAWDAAGRPTAGIATPSNGNAIVQTFTYNDTTRTQTIASGGTTCSQTFDQNGNPASAVCSGSPQTQTTTVFTTVQICR